jgi:hypothetical protein
MHFATRVRTWRVARLHSETALSLKPFGLGHMYIYTFLRRMTDTMTSQNIDLSSWDTLYSLTTDSLVIKSTEKKHRTARLPFKIWTQSLLNTNRKWEVLHSSWESGPEPEAWVRAPRLIADIVSVAGLMNRGVTSTLCLLWAGGVGPCINVWQGIEGTHIRVQWCNVCESTGHVST